MFGSTIRRAAEGGPRVALLHLLVREAGLLVGENDLLHHLTDDTIGENHGRAAILERQLEGKVYEVCHLLDRVRGKHDDIVVAVATTTS